MVTVNEMYYQSSFLLFAVLLTLLSVYKPCLASDDDPTKGCHNPADIVFVLDESGSIWGPHFTKQLEFVQNVVGLFDVRQDKTRIGVLTFGDVPRIIFHLGHHTSEAAMKNDIKGIKQMRGETYTNDALRVARTEMLSSQRIRDSIPHICIVITDGESNNPDETALEADHMHRTGIQTFAIGVGPYVNKNELQVIASSPDLVFEVDDYGALDGLKQILAWKACQVSTLPPPTTTPAPPQMIEGCTGYKPMDNIWSIPDLADERENDLALDLIADVSSEMTIGPNRVQVGLTQRNCQPGAEIRLKEHDTVNGIREALDRRRYNTSATTYKHLREIRTPGMQAASGGRADAVKFGILIIDRQQGNNLARARTEAKKAKDEGIKLIVIGVGSDVEESELNAIASSPSDVLTCDSYSELSTLKSSIIDRLCNGLMSSSSLKQRHISIKRYFNVYEDE